MKNNGNKPTRPTGHSQSGTGLTKREHFAAMAMQGILSNGHFSNEWKNDFKSGIELCTTMADSLLKALDENPT